MGKDEVRKAVIESFDGDLVTAEQGIEPVKVTVQFWGVSSVLILILRKVNKIATDNNVARRLSRLRLPPLTGDSRRTTVSDRNCCPPIQRTGARAIALLRYN
jgi:hypothetical protein